MKKILFATIVLASMVSCLKYAQPQSKDKKPPNFLFIVVDDQSPFDFKMYNAKSMLESPNIDKLAKEGVVFDGAYHMGSMSGAVCTPSRHMMMSGRTLWNITSVKLPQRERKNKRQ